MGAELRAFFDIGERRSIPLSEEIALCRSHAATMGHMLDRELRIEVQASDPEQRVPPGLLLTLVENAITHGDFRAQAGTIVITQATTEDPGCVLEVSNPIARKQELDRGGALNEGTGFRYVRSHLEDAFVGGWGFDWRIEGGRWITRIRLPATLA